MTINNPVIQLQLTLEIHFHKVFKYFSMERVNFWSFNIYTHLQKNSIYNVHAQKLCFTYFNFISKLHILWKVVSLSSCMCQLASNFTQHSPWHSNKQKNKNKQLTCNGIPSVKPEWVRAIMPRTLATWLAVTSLTPYWRIMFLHSSRLKRIKTKQKVWLWLISCL